MATNRARGVVLVTGSSSGIGQACAVHLADHGWRTYGGSRRALVSAAAVDDAGPAVTPLALDVTDQASVDAAVCRILDDERRIDILVHCAGISVAGAIEDLTIDEVRHQLETNYIGAVRMVRAVLPAMRSQRSGRIVIVGSIGGLIGLPFIGHYSASKFALDGFVEALRHEISPFGITAAIVHPGDFRTDISSNQIEGAATGPASPYHEAFRRTVDTYDLAVRTAREPEIVARAVDRLLRSRHMPVRVVVGTPVERSGLGLKRVLPARWFERVIRKSYRL